MKLPLLIDLDGVLRLGNTPAPGIDKFFEYISSGSRKSVVISNTTQKTAKTVMDYFNSRGMPIPCDVLTAADATALYVKSRFKKAAVYAMPEVKLLFSDILDYTQPEVVVMGDMGKAWDFENLNAIFKYVQNGAELIAMQKNKFWSTPEDGLLLDLGAFVTAIEYATGKSATLIGKPSPVYFNSGLEKIGMPDNKFVMIGDDLENDIKGAQKSGGIGILILTGKTKLPLDDKHQNTPDFIVRNLQEAVDLLEKID